MADPKTLKEAVSQLTAEQKQRLRIALDNGVCTTINLPNGFWVAVFSNQTALARENMWSFGKQ